MKNQVNKLKTYSLVTFIKRFDINEMRNEFKTDFAFFTQFTPNKTAKKKKLRITKEDKSVACCLLCRDIRMLTLSELRFTMG